MQAYHDATLNLDQLPVRFSTKEKSASVLPAIARKSLLSLGKLCDNGCDYISLYKNTLALLLMASQPSSAQEILPTDFVMST